MIERELGLTIIYFLFLFLLHVLLIACCMQVTHGFGFDDPIAVSTRMGFSGTPGPWQTANTLNVNVYLEKRVCVLF